MMDLEHPSISKTIPEDEEVIKLPPPESDILKTTNIFDCISKRQSRRKFNSEPLSQKELSYLLWATQGVKKEFDHKRFSRRTVPSAGARHPFETYLAVNNVEGLKTGIYRYLPFSHSIVFLYQVENFESRLKEAALDQRFAGECAVSFIWTAIPYRTEWRYSTESKKLILQDSGHLCQNLYLACESIQCGTCAISAYDQKKMDSIIQVDGEEEFTMYLSPVGKYL
ncbi:MAG: SagB/ThcOx family dehydrogenase [bacterium]|nr:SagB/ThcOx family dehydrogenase [bacterium]